MDEEIEMLNQGISRKHDDILRLKADIENEKRDQQVLTTELNNEHIIPEQKNRVSKGFETISDTTYEKFVDQTRNKIIPNNKNNPIRYSDWVTVKSYKEAVKQQTKEKNNRVERGFVYIDNVRFMEYVDQERTIVTNLRTNQVESVGPWIDVNSWKEERGRKTTVVLSRKVTQEEKSVSHHGAHSMFGFSSHDHTHYNVYSISYIEESTQTTDYDGAVSQTGWTMRPGTYSKRLSHDGRERGFTSGYTRIVNITNL